MLFKMGKFRKGDTVVVISGKERGNRGVVLMSIPEKLSLVVEKIKVVRKHLRQNGNIPAGIIDKNLPILSAKVKMWCSSCSKGVKVGFRVQKDVKERFCSSCQASI